MIYYIGKSGTSRLYMYVYYLDELGSSVTQDFTKFLFSTINIPK